MKNIFLLLLMTSCFQLAFAQDDDPIHIKFAPTLTEIGKPVGEKLTQQIDKEGGRIVSADKQVELIIPQDAVSKKTDISIQSVENTLTPGSGNSYHLEPSGMSFQKPLQIIFHYSSKEDAPIPGLRNIAWQDEKGQWNALDSSVVDTTAKTVTGNITHFSYWVFFDYFSLKPAGGRVKVGKTIQLELICTYPGGLSDDFKTGMLKKINFVSYVNGVRKGNATVGTISSAAHIAQVELLSYNAPANVPDDNPVAVSVEASNITFNRNTYSKIKLVSNIAVYDKAYEIRVKGYNEQFMAGCTIKSIDSSSCTVVLKGKHSTMGDIQNMNVKVDASKCKRGCPVTEINAGNSSGPINIEGAAKIEIIPASPPEKPFREIRVYFIRSVGVMPGWHAPPCGHINDVVTPPMSLPALPFGALRWDDDDIVHTTVGGDEKNGFEIKIIPVKDH